MMSRADVSAGYRSTWFQLKVASSVVEEAAELKPPTEEGGNRKSREASTSRAPAGTSQWKAYMSASSRFQATLLPPAESFNPARSVMGPVGACSPGIHFG